jgi:hypothetical protein
MNGSLASWLTFATVKARQIKSGVVTVKHFSNNSFELGHDWTERGSFGTSATMLAQILEQVGGP